MLKVALAVSFVALSAEWVCCDKRDKAATVITEMAHLMKTLPLYESLKGAYVDNLSNAQHCLEPLVAHESLPALADHTEKLKPLLTDCLPRLQRVEPGDYHEIEEVMDDCLHDGLKKNHPQADAKQKDLLPKLRKCLVDAIHGHEH